MNSYLSISSPLGCSLLINRTSSRCIMDNNWGWSSEFYIFQSFLHFYFFSFTNSNNTTITGKANPKVMISWLLESWMHRLSNRMPLQGLLGIWWSEFRFFLSFLPFTSMVLCDELEWLLMNNIKIFVQKAVSGNQFRSSKLIPQIIHQKMWMKWWSCGKHSNENRQEWKNIPSFHRKWMGTGGRSCIAE